MKAEEIIASLIAAGQHVATAESLTGGLVCAVLVDPPGASEVVRGGIVAYQPEMKSTLLGVSADLIEERGTVCAEVATALASGARRELGAAWGVGTTGVAGPGPSEGRAQGTVFVAVAGPDDVAVAEELHLSGDRNQVRSGAVDAALSLLRARLREQAGSGPR
ncbi:hypothetical protein BHE97_14760 [Aeromicrobium sp. PE09-221]|uniref:CinA family protein n=1 Tax=Aeromicrobium sp. PE09-221 TaxID=1898043 RepID=UPI000B3E6EE4|nr:nicotinamide-nucleotide amidohydrolase family protein [Aeromicrobium sp. PE09-221]OUZ07960.1 hypothetical protein BHE97_14760 [Aeromicrobium sp. PE09-221]